MKQCPLKKVKFLGGQLTLVSPQSIFCEGRVPHNSPPHCTSPCTFLHRDLLLPAAAFYQVLLIYYVLTSIVSILIMLTTTSTVSLDPSNIINIVNTVM